MGDESNGRFGNRKMVEIVKALDAVGFGVESFTWDDCSGAITIVGGIGDVVGLEVEVGLPD